jgi:uncharacterized membrane protein (DUF2068 family)
MKSSHDRMLRVIAVFKFLKAATLIAASLGAFRFLHHDLGDAAEQWVRDLKLDPGNRFVVAALRRIANLSAEQIRRLGLVGLVYAALFVTEGTGLWLLKPWGEWVTVIISGSLVPVEIYEILRHVTLTRAAVVTVNVAVVVYLMVQIRSRKQRESGSV